MVVCQQAGMWATAVKPVRALHFSLGLSFVQAKERTESKSRAINTNEVKIDSPLRSE
jgi:hypothetical protein